MTYRVWHIPQVPMEPFYVEEIASLETAIMVRDVLAEYDLFQFENNIKPDYSNAQGIEEFEDGEWSEVDDDELAEWGDPS